MLDREKVLVTSLNMPKIFLKYNSRTEKQTARVGPQPNEVVDPMVVITQRVVEKEIAEVGKY